MRMTRLQVENGNRAPVGFGVAWYDHADHVLVLMPMPINLIAGALRRLYLWAMNPWRSRYTAGEAAAYRKGLNDGANSEG